MAIVLKKHAIITYLLVLGFLGSCSARSFSDSVKDSSVRERFRQWAAEHGKTYSDDAEREKRFVIFRQNLRFVEDFNRGGNRSFTVGLNAFSDLTKEEFSKSFTGNRGTPWGSRNSTGSGSFRVLDESPVPDSVDWVQNGAVTAVRNQGKCGCCWAFSAVAAIEGMIKIQSGKLLSLSEQQLLDCVTENSGCSGGMIDKAFSYVAQNKISTEFRYPYREAKFDCAPPIPAATISGFVRVTPSSEPDLLQAVARQPVAVAIRSSDLFRAYKDGIFRGTDCTGTQILDHTVAVVGFGTDLGDGSKFWLVKNSWGTSWGEAGFMRIAREEPGQPSGVCGMAVDATYPV